MRQILFLILLGLCIYSCKSAMNIKQISLKNELPSLNENSSVVEFGIDTQIPDSIKRVEIGAYKIRDGGMTVNCSYETVLNLAKAKARSVGGNVVKITEHKLPSPMWSSCHQLDFVVYKIQDVGPFENQFYWTSERELEWNDFKDAPKLNLPFYTCVFISANFNSEKFLSSKGNISVKPVFNTDCSWVQPPYKNKNGLQLANAHFDLAGIYADKIKRAFEAKQIDSYDKWQKYAEDIYKQLNKEFETEVYNLYTQTSYGNNSSELIAWKFQIDQQLNQL